LLYKLQCVGCRVFCKFVCWFWCCVVCFAYATTGWLQLCFFCLSCRSLRFAVLSDSCIVGEVHFLYLLVSLWVVWSSIVKFPVLDMLCSGSAALSFTSLTQSSSVHSILQCAGSENHKQNWHCHFSMLSCFP
jgi:hypothetical protein